MQENHCNVCGAEVFSKGLCKRCYQKEYRKKNPDKLKRYNEAYKERYPEKIKDLNKTYRESHKEKISLYKKEWAKNNPEKVRELGRKSTETYRKNHKEQVCEYHTEYCRKRKSNDALYKFKCGVRSMICDSFKRRGTNKRNKTENILGCSIEEFKKYIESKFEDGMTFENYGEWHLDHIKPLATAKTFDEVLELCHYTNFQPLWAEDNLRKSAKWNE